MTRRTALLPWWAPLLLTACTVQTGLSGLGRGGTPARPAPAGSGDATTTAAAPAADVVEPAIRSGTCDAANEHCLPDNTWMTTGGPAATGPVSLCYEAGGAMFEYETKPPRPCPGTAFHRTVAASASNVKPGARVVVYARGGLPAPEHGYSVFVPWKLHVVKALDGDTVRFDPHGAESLASARVVVETKVVFPPATTAAVAAWQRAAETDATFSGDRPEGLPGPKPALGAARCDAANNHCLHGNTWFVVDPAEDPDEGWFCFRARGALWSWHRLDRCNGGVAIRSAPARRDQLSAGMTVLVYEADEAVPSTAARARSADAWRLRTIDRVEGDAVWFVGLDAPAHVGTVRVEVERTPWKP